MTPTQGELAFEDPPEESLRWAHVPGWTALWRPAPCPDCGALAACDRCLADVAALVSALGETIESSGDPLPAQREIAHV